ncbi:MAG TPA: NADH-quinone oxidoreductase subunit NuoH [Anaerolineales bacterium]|nr:NADH-quinone oxidoreductase subunit NuoH [Anaerolineales bacterium]
MISDPFTWFGDLLREFLVGLGLTTAQATGLMQFLGAGALATAVLVLTFLLIWVERKVLARIQDRLGPNRVGPFGLLQTIADALKLLSKEIIIPSGADKVVYFLAPPLAVMSVVGLWAVIPLAPNLVGTDINVAAIYLISITAIGTLAIMLAGWSSNNKYALLGAFRTVAMLISYEVPMVLALLVPTMLAGSMGTVAIVEAQREMWFVVLAPLAALVFFISSMAEAGKAPFDLLEAESEIVAGYNIEYSSMAFGMFFVGEFLHGFTLAALTVTLFLGGWLGPFVDQYTWLGLIYFFGKTAIVYFAVIWIRGTLPRLRIDQVNAFNWKFLVPLALVVVMVTAVADKLAADLGWNRTLTMILANAVMFAGIVVSVQLYARRERRRIEAAVPASAGTARLESAS